MNIRTIAATTGTFNAVASGSQVNGATLFTGNDVQNVAALSALVTVLAETNTFTITPKWQVSSDNSTFYDLGNSNNAANVTLATGTAGTDTAVSKALMAPDAVYGWPFARLTLVAGGTTGQTADTWSIGYQYRDPSP